MISEAVTYHYLNASMLDICLIALYAWPEYSV